MARAAIANLGISFTARTTRWNKGAKKVMRDLRQLGLAVGGVAVGMGAMLARSISVADQLGKTAEIAGVTAEELQSLRFAAERSGASAGTMDSALKVLTKRMGEAKLGTGSLVTFLKRYDETLLEALVNTNDTREALGLIAEAMRNAENATDRNALAAAAFSRGLGFDMVLALKGGEEALAEFDKQARASGGYLSEQMTKDAARAQDAIDNLKRTVSTTAIAFGAQFADEIADVADWFRTRLPNAIKATAVAFSTVGRIIGVAGAALGAFFSGDFGTARELGNITFGDIFRDAQAAVDKAFGNLGNSGGKAEEDPEAAGESPTQKVIAEESTKQTQLMETQQQLTVQLIDGVRTITNIPARAG